MGISLQDAQQLFTDQAVRTQYGLILPPGSRVAAYVRSTGQQSGDDAFLSTNLVATLALGLARVRAGLGDFVVCLPGHVETVTDGTTFSNALLAGTKIIGVGKGSNTPTFNWTAVAGSWAVNKADVTIAGLRLNVGGLGSPTVALAISAADCGIYYNEFIVSSATPTNTVTTISVLAGGDRFDFTGNIVRGTASQAVGAGINVTGAVNDIRICDNEMMFSSPDASGLVQIAAACPGHKILRNVLNNTRAASVVALLYSNVATTGQCSYNSITVLNTGAQTGGTTGITVGGTNNLTGYFQNFIVNDANKSGILQPAADT